MSSKNVKDLESTSVPLQEIDWVKELIAEKGASPAVTSHTLLHGDSSLGVDHLLTNFLKTGFIKDLLYVSNSEEKKSCVVVTFGRNVCGHPKVVHGGLLSTILDETFGVCVYSLKAANLIPAGPSFTVHLEVDYKKPVFAHSTMVCHAKLSSVEGRKCWVEAELKDSINGEVFVTGKALFVTVVSDKGPAVKDELAEKFNKLNA